MKRQAELLDLSRSSVYYTVLRSQTFPRLG